MSILPDVGTGATIAFGTSSFTAQIRKISGPNVARDMFETTHLGSTAPTTNQFGGKTWIAGDLQNPGEITLELNWNGDLRPPIRGASETVTITFPILSGNSVGATVYGPALVQSFEHAIGTEELLAGTVVLKCSGVWTQTLGS